MIKSSLALHPYPLSSQQQDQSQLYADIGVVDEHQLIANFQYQANENEQLQLPKLKSAHPSRQDNLWQTTCFELFLQPENLSPQYWEINFSPAGDWNVYRFSDYRKDMQTELSVKNIQLEELHIEDNMTSCRFRLSLPPEINGAIRVGVTAVIDTQNGSKSYWALAHAGDKPDFHLSQSFIHRLQVGASS